MKRIWKAVFALAAVALASQAQAVNFNLDGDNGDAVKLQMSPYWNLKGAASGTTWSLTSKDGTALSGLNYGIAGVGSASLKINAPLSLTQTSCAANWGSSGSHAVYAYIGNGVNGTNKGPALCVSDRPNLTAVGSVAATNSGYVLCSKTLNSADSLRQIGQASINCTGPVLSAYSETSTGHSGSGVLNARFSGTATSATTGSTTLAFTVQGVQTSDSCVVTPVSFGTGPSFMKSATSAANAINIVVDANQTAGSTKIAYVCY